MIRYKLLTETSQYPKGTLFTFEEKHRFISQLPWQMTRSILWEKVELWN